METKFALVQALAVTHVDLFGAHCCFFEFVVFKAGRQPDATKTPASVADISHRTLIYRGVEIYGMIP